ncbi:MAG: hypothetical protein JRN18_02590 [Nitrososphaerota archaeon]|jgi:hypothetical protein|nr:hypothetical protein [Nitrososphaerota archaeon]MDG6948143.1 hypothetical protein [Nitrososphaerota archaeon]
MASDETGSLAGRAEERFFTLDHVGVVRHFEGAELQRVQSAVRSMLDERGSGYEDALEERRGRKVYTNVASLRQEGGLTLWVSATLVEPVGVVVEAKLFHSTEQSAEADEQLSLFVNGLQERVIERG